MGWMGGHMGRKQAENGVHCSPCGSQVGSRADAWGIHTDLFSRIRIRARQVMIPPAKAKSCVTSVMGYRGLGQSSFGLVYKFPLLWGKKFIHHTAPRAISRLSDRMSTSAWGDRTISASGGLASCTCHCRMANGFVRQDRT